MRTSSMTLARRALVTVGVTAATLGAVARTLSSMTAEKIRTELAPKLRRTPISRISGPGRHRGRRAAGRPPPRPPPG